MSYLYVLITIVLTVYGQIVIKWQLAGAGPMPESTADQPLFILKLLLNPWILSGLAAAFAAALAWMGALTKLDLSHAYPFMSLSFVLVAAASVLLFNEAMTLPKIAGLALIVAGIVIGAHG